jgi:hypothetical protein
LPGFGVESDSTHQAAPFNIVPSITPSGSIAVRIERLNVDPCVATIQGG